MRVGTRNHIGKLQRNELESEQERGGTGTESGLEEDGSRMEADGSGTEAGGSGTEAERKRDGSEWKRDGSGG